MDKPRSRRRPGRTAGDVPASADAPPEARLADRGAAEPDSPAFKIQSFRLIERHLTHFVVVAQEQHFQRAAARLGITQSALSRRIQLLEQELEVLLFERSARGVRLTAAGESFYSDVRKILQDLGEATMRARSITLGNRGRLNVGINPSSANNPIIVNMLNIFRERHESIELHLHMMYSEDQINALQAQIIDVGIVYHYNPIKLMKSTLVSEDRLLLILPVSHPLAEKPAIGVSDLEAEPFVWPRRSQSPELADWLIGSCHQHGLAPRIAMEVHSVESAVSIVGLGIGLGFVMANQVDQLPPTVVAREVEGLSLQLPLRLVWRSDVDIPILSRLQDALAQAQGPGMVGGRQRWGLSPTALCSAGPRIPGRLPS